MYPSRAGTGLPSLGSRRRRPTCSGESSGKRGNESRWGHTGMNVPSILRPRHCIPGGRGGSRASFLHCQLSALTVVLRRARSRPGAPRQRVCRAATALGTTVVAAGFQAHRRCDAPVRGRRGDGPSSISARATGPLVSWSLRSHVRRSHGAGVRVQRSAARSTTRRRLSGRP